MTDQRDEWTMICPPGRMDEAVAMADSRPENIREIVASPAAGDRFILVNDTAQARYWAMFTPVINTPGSLIRLSGI